MGHLQPCLLFKSLAVCAACPGKRPHCRCLYNLRGAGIRYGCEKLSGLTLWSLPYVWRAKITGSGASLIPCSVSVPRLVAGAGWGLCQAPQAGRGAWLQNNVLGQAPGSWAASSAGGSSAVSSESGSSQKGRTREGRVAAIPSSPCCHTQGYCSARLCTGYKPQLTPTQHSPSLQAYKKVLAANAAHAGRWLGKSSGCLILCQTFYLVPSHDCI